MYGDTAAIKKRVSQLLEQAIDVRGLADRMVAQAESVDWQGRAADDMRTRMRDRAEHLRECALRHDNAAQALERHLGEVARLKESIADIEQKAGSLVADAHTRVAEIESHVDPDGIRREATHTDRTLTSFTPPPAGHKDWLSVELPGL